MSNVRFFLFLFSPACSFFFFFSFSFFASFSQCAISHKILLSLIIIIVYCFSFQKIGRIVKSSLCAVFDFFVVVFLHSAESAKIINFFFLLFLSLSE
jgi:hypothetical protein